MRIVRIVAPYKRFHLEQRKENGMKGNYNYLGNLEKIRPLSVDGEFEEGVEAWLLKMSKYFHIYSYLGILKARLVVIISQCIR